MMGITEKELAKVGSDKAKAEMEERRRQAREEEAPVLTAAQEEEKRLKAGGCDWALLNYYLSTRDLRKKKFTGLKDMMYFTYEMIWPAIGVLRKDDKRLKEILIQHLPNEVIMDNNAEIKELLEKKDPVQIAHDALNKIKELAKTRALRNMYTPKKVEV